MNVGPWACGWGARGAAWCGVVRCGVPIYPCRLCLCSPCLEALPPPFHTRSRSNAQPHVLARPPLPTPALTPLAFPHASPCSSASPPYSRTHTLSPCVARCVVWVQGLNFVAALVLETVQDDCAAFNLTRRLFRQVGAHTPRPPHPPPPPLVPTLLQWWGRRCEAGMDPPLSRLSVVACLAPCLCV